MPITMIILLLGLFGAFEIHGLHLTVKDKATNKNCLILEANITGTIQYVSTSNTTVSLPFQVPEDGSVVATGDSVCGSDVDKLQVEFFPTLSLQVNETEPNFKWKINLEFNKTGSNIMEQRYQLNNYALTVFFYNDLNSTEYNVTIPHTFSKPAEVQPEWMATAKSEQKNTSNGFNCSQNQLPLNVTDSSLVFKKLKVVAFAQQEGNDFVQTQLFEQCILDVRTSDLVAPILTKAREFFQHIYENACSLCVLVLPLLLISFLILCICCPIRRFTRGAGIKRQPWRTLAFDGYLTPATRHRSLRINSHGKKSDYRSSSKAVGPSAAIKTTKNPFEGDSAQSGDEDEIRLV